MKIILVCILSLSFFACASPPQLTINSSVPARIEMDGITVCDQSPCTVIPPHYVGGFKECKETSPAYLEAFPIDKSQGYTQTKRVIGTCGKTEQVYFDMQSRSAVATPKDPQK